MIGTRFFKAVDLLEKQLGLLDLHIKVWRDLCGARAYPLLSDLFDRADPILAPSLVIIDIENDDVQRLRLIGTRIVDFFGVDPTGSDFLPTVVAPAQTTFVDCHRRLRLEPVGKLHRSICSTTSGREVEVYALALPYMRKAHLPCAVWLLIPGEDLRFGEYGAEVRAIVEERWVNLRP